MKDSRRWSVVAGLAAAVLLALGVISCGEKGPENSIAPVVGEGLPPEVEHPVTETVNRLQRAFIDRDYKGLCNEMTSQAAQAAGEAAHGDVTTCERDIRRLLGLIREGGGLRHSGVPRVTAVDVDGSQAISTVALDRRWQARVPLTRNGGGWKLSGFFGASRSHAARTMAAIPRSDFPPMSKRGTLEVREPGGARCTDLSEDNYPIPSGGCRINFSTGIVPLTILTPLGDFEFERCSIAYDVLVDASGRTWTEHLEVGGRRDSQACGDVSSCYDIPRDVIVPWRGRLYPDGNGRYLHRASMCLQTCVGYFLGDFEVQLWQENGRWRAEPVNGGGDTGFRFDAPLRVKGDFEVREGADGAPT